VVCSTSDAGEGSSTGATASSQQPVMFGGNVADPYFSAPIQAYYKLSLCGGQSDLETTASATFSFCFYQLCFPQFHFHCCACIFWICRHGKVIKCCVCLASITFVRR